jgi:hypothetical protein
LAFQGDVAWHAAHFARLAFTREIALSYRFTGSAAAVMRLASFGLIEVVMSDHMKAKRPPPIFWRRPRRAAVCSSKAFSTASPLSSVSLALVDDRNDALSICFKSCDLIQVLPSGFRNWAEALRLE